MNPLQDNEKNWRVAAITRIPRTRAVSFCIHSCVQQNEDAKIKKQLILILNLTLYCCYCALGGTPLANERGGAMKTRENRPKGTVTVNAARRPPFQKHTD